MKERKYMTPELHQLIGEAAMKRSLEDVKKEIIKLYTVLKEDLETALNGNGDIFITRTIDRKIGKTVSLIRLACEYHLPLAVRGDLAKMYERDAMELYNKTIKVIPVRKGSRIKRGEKHTIVLKDEGISVDDVLEYFKPEIVKVVGISSFFDD